MRWPCIQQQPPPTNRSPVVAMSWKVGSPPATSSLHHPGGNPGAFKWFLESTPIPMPPGSGGICGRLTYDLPPGCPQMQSRWDAVAPIDEDAEQPEHSPMPAFLPGSSVTEPYLEAAPRAVLPSGNNFVSMRGAVLGPPAPTTRSGTPGTGDTEIIIPASLLLRGKQFSLRSELMHVFVSYRYENSTS